MIQLVKEWTVAEDDDMTFKHPPIKKSWVAYKIRKKSAFPSGAMMSMRLSWSSWWHRAPRLPRGSGGGGLSSQPFQLQDVSKLVYNIL